MSDASSAMTHLGYQARVEFGADDCIFVGRLVGIRDVVGFHGSTMAELEAAFREAFDGYVAACEAMGQAPDKPFSGRLMLRLAPEVHGQVNRAAEVSGMCVNQWVARTLSDAVDARHTSLP